MLSRVLLVIFLASAGMFSLGGVAHADACRNLRLQMLQAQASGEMARYRRAAGMLARTCGGQRGRSIFDDDSDLPQFLRPQRERRARVERPDRQESRRRSLAAAPKRPAILARPAPKRAPAPQMANTAPREEPRRGRSKPRMSVAGTLRTWCVRTCDGYYFPISFSTTQDRLDEDQAACQQACPAAEALVYYHRASGEAPEQMVSISGSAYAELPVAFSYRTALNPSCSCGKPGAARVDMAVGADKELEPAIPRLPRPRPAPGEDPETLANRDGGFVPKFLPRPLAVAEQGPPSGIRVVGADDAPPVPVSPVPNDLETSLLWSSRE